MDTSMHRPSGAMHRPSEAAMALLGDGVPLSLLLDLVLGPRSEELLAMEAARASPGAVD